MEISGYRIEKPIGEGGMATAYLAVQESLGRLTVLKVLNANSQDNKEYVERFLNEGRIVASLNHPHIVTIYDIGISEECMYISMEYIEGGDLRSRIKKTLPPTEALDIIKKICGGLDAAHRKGIVHRDVKPGNILFDKSGEPLLTDFGIAKRLTMEQDLTTTGVFLGSPNYMAPEQAEDGPIDGRADIYALGVIFYEMLTGNKPYRSESVIDVIVKHKQEPIPTLPDQFKIYQPLLNLMMAKKRKDRFRDASSVLHFIHHLEKVSLDASTNEQATPLEKKDPTADEIFMTQLGIPKKNHRWPLYILGGLLFMSASALAVVSYLNMKLNKEISSFNTVHMEVSDLDTMIKLAPIPTPDSAPVEQKGDEEVTKALSWLARKSLEEYRLTAPPKDNAYYYYSRLLEINPKNSMARQGLMMIAEKFAYLAEKELAEDERETAVTYINIGLRINPKNRTLQQLKALTNTEQPSFLKRVADLFKS